MAEERKWFVYYTKSRSEKKVDKLLKREGFESFLPLQKVVRQWSDRKKKVEVPLFNSYIFVRVPPSELQKVLLVPGIAWNIRHNGAPAIIRNEEINLIRRFLETGLYVDTDRVEHFDKGDKVEVIDGPLRGAVGFVTGDYNEQLFTMSIDTIDQTLTVRIEGKLLRKV